MGIMETGDATPFFNALLSGRIKSDFNAISQSPENALKGGGWFNSALNYNLCRLKPQKSEIN